MIGMEMKWKAMALAFALAWLSNVAAQKPTNEQKRYAVAYRTEIKTTSGKSTGVLEQVTDSNVVVRNDLNGYDYRVSSI